MAETLQLECALCIRHTHTSSSPLASPSEKMQIYIWICSICGDYSYYKLKPHSEWGDSPVGSQIRKLVQGRSIFSHFHTSQHGLQLTSNCRTYSSLTLCIHRDLKTEGGLEKSNPEIAQNGF